MTECIFGKVRSQSFTSPIDRQGARTTVTFVIVTASVGRSMRAETVAIAWTTSVYLHSPKIV